MIGKKIIIGLILAVIFFSMTGFSLAAPSWWPLVPCGTSVNPRECNRCDLFKLLKNIIDFVLLGLMPPVAMILFVWGGFLILMGGANPKWVARGKEIFWSTFKGILIILASWMITNTIIQNISEPGKVPGPWWQYQCTATVGATTGPPGGSGQTYSCNSNNQCIADATGQYSTSNCDNNCAPATNQLVINTTSLPNGQIGVNYSQTISVSGGKSPYDFEILNGNLPPGLVLNNVTGVISGTPTTNGTHSFTINIVDDSLPDNQSVEKQLTIIIGANVTTNCGDFNAVCLSLSCPALVKDTGVSSGQSSWAYLIPAVAAAHPISGVDTAKFLEAIMRIETGGRIDQISSSDPPSCGLMQLQAAEAQKFASKCGVTTQITCDWLRGRTGASLDVVAKASICMAAEYSISVRNSNCYKGQVRDLAAAYNGGGGCDSSQKDDNALALSISCSQQSTAVPKYETDCSGRSTVRYECLWDDLTHSTCNTGFKETRDYAGKFNGCYNK